MKNALVFSGQGTHHKGMCLSLLSDPAVTQLWDRMKERMMCNFGVSLQDIIQGNPKKTTAYPSAFNIEEIFKRPCTTALNTKESTPRSHIITHPEGVMQYTYFTQPCVLAAQLLAYEKLRRDSPAIYNSQIAAVAGHSLGEFTALTAIGVFSPETAVDLTFKRGLLMEEACKAVPRGDWKMFACSPSRAQLDKDPEVADNIFFTLVELVASTLSHTSSFVEVVNYNLRHQQYVVAGDLVGLAVLGKCLDPQFRANCDDTGKLETLVQHAFASVKMDKKDGVAKDPNRTDDSDFVTSAVKKYGSRSVMRRFIKGADDGYTPVPEDLTHLTLQEDGRSGLKKKSWYIPLTVEIPFHSSKLRSAMDHFLPVVRSALPDESHLRDIFSITGDGVIDKTQQKFPLWVTNLTGLTFDPLTARFQDAVVQRLSQYNVGENRHKGRYESSLVLDTFQDAVAQGSVREMTAAVLAAQLAHPVQWITAMDELVLGNHCTRLQEISPQKNVSELLKRASFPDPSKGVSPITLTVSSFPKETPIL